MTKTIVLSLFISMLVGCGGESDKDKSPTASIGATGDFKEYSQVEFTPEIIKRESESVIDVKWSISPVDTGVSLEPDGINGAILTINDVGGDYNAVVTMVVSDDSNRSNSYEYDVQVTDTLSSHRTRYPQIIDGNVTISDYKTRDVVFTTITDEFGDFIIPNEKFDDESVYLITVSDGAELSGIPNNGSVGAFASGSDLVNKTTVISAFSDAIARSVNSVVSKMTTDEFKAVISHQSTSLFNDDLTRDLVEGDALDIVSIEKADVFNISDLHNVLISAVSIDTVESALLSAYYNGSEDELVEKINDLFHPYLSFGDIDRAIVKSNVLSLTFFGSGNITSPSGLVDFDTERDTDNGFKDFVIPEGVNEVTLKLEMIGDYSVSDWKGCSRFDGDDCVVDTMSSTSVSITLSAPPVYANNYVSLDGIVFSSDEVGELLYSVGDDQNALDTLRGLNVGDYISSNEGDGFLAKVDGVNEISDGEFEITLGTATLKDVLVGGTFSIDRAITNEDIAKSASVNGSGSGSGYKYTPGALVSFGGSDSMFVELSEDKNSKSIKLYSNESSDVNVTSSSVWSNDGELIKSGHAIISVPTEVRLNASFYVDVSGDFERIGSSYSVEFHADPNAAIEVSTPVRYKSLRKNIGSKRIAYIGTALGPVDIYISAAFTGGFGASGTIGIAVSLDANSSAGIYYDSSMREGARFTVKTEGSAEGKDKRLTATAQASISAGMSLGLYSKIGFGLIELPASIFVDFGVTSKASLLHKATNSPAKCYGTLMGSISGYVQGGLKLGGHNGYINLLGFKIKTGNYNITPLSYRKVFVNRVITDKHGELHKDCYTPEIEIGMADITETLSDADFLYASYTVENKSQVDAYYSVNVDAPSNLLSLRYLSSTSGGGGSGSNEAVHRLIPGEIHSYKAKVNAGRLPKEFGLDKVYKNKVTITHERIPPFGHGIKNHSSASITVHPRNGSLTPPSYLRASAVANSYNVNLRWGYVETKYDRDRPRTFKLTRSGEGGSVVLGYPSTKNTYWNDRVPKRGNYTYSLSIVSDGDSTSSETSDVHIYSTLVGTYKGTYIWNCGDWDYGELNPDGSPKLGTNAGSTPATLIVNSDEHGYAQGSINFGLSPGSKSMGRYSSSSSSRPSTNGKVLAVSNFHARIGRSGVISGSYISGLGFDGSGCSHPSGAAAGKFTVIKQ